MKHFLPSIFIHSFIHYLINVYICLLSIYVNSQSTHMYADSEHMKAFRWIGNEDRSQNVLCANLKTPFYSSSHRVHSELSLNNNTEVAGMVSVVTALSSRHATRRMASEWGALAARWKPRNRSCMEPRFPIDERRWRTQRTCAIIVTLSMMIDRHTSGFPFFAQLMW